MSKTAEQQENLQNPESYEQILSQIETLLAEQDQDILNTKLNAFITQRLATLKESAAKRELITLGTEPHPGFILPETVIKRGVRVDGFKLDDDSVYGDFLANFNEFKQNESWQGKAPREIAPSAVNYTIAKYYGGWVGDKEKSEAYYLDRSTTDSEPFSVKELKGSGLALCAERAALAQNINAFLGLNSQLNMGQCRFGDADKPEFHAYNSITNEKGVFIAEVTNPTFIEDSDGNVQSTLPIFYPLTPDQAVDFEDHQPVEVKHNDFILQNGQYEQVDSHRFYQK